MSIPTVSVVIPTHNRRAGLPRVIDAIAADEYASEIIIVVDGCNDGSMEYLQHRSADDDRIKPVWQENSGDRVARQYGTEQAECDVVLLLDDDVIAGPGLARKHAEAHTRLPRALVLGYMPTVTPQVREPGQFATFMYADEYEKACTRYEQEPSEILRHLWSGNMSLRREDALQVTFTTGASVSRHTDQDFGLRCRAAGLDAIFDRSLAATHSHSRNLAALLEQSYSYGRARREMNRVHSASDWKDPLGELSQPKRAVVALGADPRLHELLTTLMKAALHCAGRARAWKLESGCARLLRQVALVRGFRGLAH